MTSIDKILILHDVYLAETEKSFGNWITGFRNNIRKISGRTGGGKITFELSQDLEKTGDNSINFNPKDYKAFIIVVSKKIYKSVNLLNQIDRILDYARQVPEFYGSKKLIMILLDKVSRKHEIFTKPDIKFYNFYFERKSAYNIHIINLTSNDQEYWTHTLEIHDYIIPSVEKSQSGPVKSKDATNVYLGRATFDLNDKRELLKYDLQKRGIRIFPEISVGSWKETDKENLFNMLDSCELSIQMIGKNELLKDEEESEMTDIEKEFDFISKFLSNNNQLSETKKHHSRIIWIPDPSISRNKPKSNFILRIKSQVQYIKEDTEIISGSYEQLKAYILNTLNVRIKHISQEDRGISRNSVYIIHEKNFYEQARMVAGLFKKQSLNPTLTQDLVHEESFIKAHKNTLQYCESVILFYGQQNPYWIESMVREIIKSSRIYRAARYKFILITGPLKLLEKLPKYDDFIMIDIESLSNQNFLNDHFIKMIG